MIPSLQRSPRLAGGEAYWLLRVATNSCCTPTGRFSLIFANWSHLRIHIAHLCSRVRIVKGRGDLVKERVWRCCWLSYVMISRFSGSKISMIVVTSSSDMLLSVHKRVLKSSTEINDSPRDNVINKSVKFVGQCVRGVLVIWIAIGKRAAGGE